MIQLTKGTNTLDINLSDFSGASNELVQNGQFTDIGPNTVNNGSFNETATVNLLNPNFNDIGSELVTNGDFSAVPLGSELITNGNFATGLISPWSASASGDGVVPVVEGSAGDYSVRIKNGASNGDSAITQTNIFEVGKTYELTYRVVSNANTNQLTLQGYGSLASTVQTHTVSIVGVVTRESARFKRNGANTNIVIADISIKEVLNIVTNGDFSGVTELVENGDFTDGTNDWSADGGSTISVGTHEGKTNVADINITAATTAVRVTQPFTFINGATYKVTVEVYVESGSFRLDTSDLFVPVDFVTTSTIGSWQTLTANVTAIDSGSTSLFLRSAFPSEISRFYVNTVSIINLAEDWQLVNTSIDANGARIDNGATTDNAYIQQTIPESPLGKSFVLTYDVIATNGALLALEQLTSFSLDTATTGTNRKFYFTWDRASDKITIKRQSGQSVDITIDNVRLQELGEDWVIEQLSGTVAFANDQVQIISDGGSGQTGLKQDILTDDKSYKVTLDVASISGTLKLLMGGNGYVTLITAPGVQTFYLPTATITNATFYLIRNIGDSLNVVLNSVTVQEVGQNWTVQQPAGQLVTFPNATLKIEYDSTQTQGSTGVYQDILTIGKSYKIVISVILVTGSFKIQVGGKQKDITTSGIHEFYTQAESDRIFIVRRQNSLSVTAVVDTVSVTELDPNSYWNIIDPVTTQIASNKVEITNGIGAVITQSGTESSQYFRMQFTVLDYVSGGVKGFISNNLASSYVESNGVKIQYIQGGGSGTLFALFCNAFTGNVTDIQLNLLDPNSRWIPFTVATSKVVFKFAEVDLEISALGDDVGIVQAGIIKPEKIYIISISMKATAALNVEIATSTLSVVSEVIATQAITTSYVEYSFEFIPTSTTTKDFLIHRSLGSGNGETISINSVSINSVDESQWINDPAWNPFATTLTFAPTLTDESTNNSKQFTLDTSITDGGFDGRSLHGQVVINDTFAEDPNAGIIFLKQPEFLEGFYSVEIRGYLGTYYRVLGKGMAHLQRALGEDGYNRFESYNDKVTYKAYEE